MATKKEKGKSAGGQTKPKVDKNADKVNTLHRVAVLHSKFQKGLSGYVEIIERYNAGGYPDSNELMKDMNNSVSEMVEAFRISSEVIMHVVFHKSYSN